MKRPVAISLILMLVIACGWLLTKGVLSPRETKRSFQGSSSELSEIVDRGRADEERQDRGGKRDRIKQSGDLEYLKERWMAISQSAQSGLITEECRELARESAQRLLCTGATLDLIRFLETNELSNALFVLNEEISKLLRSPDGAVARASLLTLDGNMASPESSARYCVQWSYEAGQGSSEDELKRFSVMKDKECVTSAMLGRNLAIADTDPIRAISSTLKILENGAMSGLDWLSMRDQVEKLKPDSDFAVVERLFPLENPEGKEPNSVVDVGRETLFKKWAEVDPAAAANHVMEHPERFEPAMIKMIAGAVAKANPLVGFEWARMFPEGPYFDAAAYSAIPYLRDGHPEESLELASLIGDLSVRNECIESINRSRQPGARGR